MRMLTQVTQHQSDPDDRRLSDAAYACAQELQRHGIDAQVLSYPMRADA